MGCAGIESEDSRMIGNCQQCRVWNILDEEGDPIVGYCHRKASLPILGLTDEESTPNAFWPLTEIGDFCGEFISKD